MPHRSPPHELQIDIDLQVSQRPSCHFESLALRAVLVEAMHALQTAEHVRGAAASATFAFTKN